MIPDSKATFVRRRAGSSDTVRTTHGDKGVETRVIFGGNNAEAVSAASRIRAAAPRIARACEDRRSLLRGVTLRDEQHDVLDDVAAYFAYAAEQLAVNPTVPVEYGRYVQPPRTGKTLVYAQIIAAAGVTAVVLVPTADLAFQVANELREKLPNLGVGVYCGDTKESVSGGVVVATYAIVQMHADDGTLPVSIRNASLVFCDEAHRAMTHERMSMLIRVFEPGALRIGCTATPDWSEKRILASHFPRLIHEITLQEAVELRLFARLFVRVLGLRSSGAHVRLVGGDFDPQELGALMSSDPFLDATVRVRYDVSGHAELPALICCVSQAQARAVHRHLNDNRPKGARPVGLVLGDTPSRERAEIVNGFGAGSVDTIVNVGVLIEGWDSPRCKLLIDLAPTLSLVRARQKYFRVMTKFGDAVAHICVLLPEFLARIPVFPQELFGKSVQMDGFEEWLSDQSAAAGVPKGGCRSDRPRPKPRKDRRPSFEQTGTFDSLAPRLNPYDPDEVREVILHSGSIEVIPTLDRFRRLKINHEFFKGRGIHLLRYCGILVRHRPYVRFMSKIFPDAAGTAFLRREGDSFANGEPPWVREDRKFLLRALLTESLPEVGWMTAFGPRAQERTDEDDLIDAIDRDRAIRRVRPLFSDLSIRQQTILVCRYACDDAPVPYREIGKIFYVGGERARQVELGALSTLRARFGANVDSEPAFDMTEDPNDVQDVP